MQHYWLALALIQSVLAHPTLLAVREDKRFEWTALGDSYASGVGSRNYVDGRRCLRYDQAWPVMMNGDGTWEKGDYIFNNAVCSGSHYNDVEDYQLYDEDHTNQPNFQYSPRPKFGDPRMATLAVGGDDIDFPGIVFNCILEVHIWGGPRSRSCDDQRAHSWGLIKDQKLVNNISELIDKVVIKGRQGTIGDKFTLYVTGYAEFFNDIDTGCDTVTFARTANPNNDGNDHQMMTTEIRKDFNAMSRGLNDAIRAAVDRNKDRGVTFIDIQADGSLDGHRFCEQGIKEPDQQNDKLFFLHYPYNMPDDKSSQQILDDATNKVTNGLSEQALGAKFQNGDDYTNAILDAINENDAEAEGLWSYIGSKAKVFHPQVNFHTHIKTAVIKQYEHDHKDNVNAGPPGVPAPDVNACHGVSGDHWVMHKETAVSNVDAFCSQTAKSVEFNQGTVDHLGMEVWFGDGKNDKSVPDAPDCRGHMNSILNECDKDDINNPHDYKFGSTITTHDGWNFKLSPLSQQINELSCDVSYQFVLDGFEIRGSNWPDAKLGKYGDGLKSQISGCGALTKWNFEWTPNDVKYQFFASGQLPVGTKACVGRAVQGAGGANAGGCKGAGKKRALTF